MAQIVINEISQNYTYNAGNSSFCTVALPITSCWGPGYEDPAALGVDKATELESVSWRLFRSNQQGLESYVATFRGPAANYRSAKDYSYQMAMTLLTSGYDVLVCRLCPGTRAQATITDSVSENTLTFKAKYAGTFGNNIVVNLAKVVNKNYWNLIVYVIDASGIRTAVENIVFAFDLDDSTDSIVHVSEVRSNFVDLALSGAISENANFGDISDGVQLGSTPATQGTDRAADGTPDDMMTQAISIASARFAQVGSSASQYVAALNAVKAANPSVSTASKIRYNEWIYWNALDVLDLLKDKLAYSPNRVISPWDDQNITEIDGSAVVKLDALSPIHIKLMEVANYGRCVAALIDIPKCLPRSAVYNDSASVSDEGYAQKLSRYQTGSDGLFASHSALFAPWGQYTYVGTSKQNAAPPSFLALLIQRAMILNQSLQYEWAMPTSRRQSVPVGQLDYTVPKKLLDTWQSSEGVRVNVITNIPDLGTGIWGNSTLFELPPATYQALANLSTRYLVNAVEDVVYRCALGITFQYNNDEAYSRFYAGVTPLLDTMKNVGAIEGYLVRMSADINGLDQVNANSVIGKIYLQINGVIENITVDLVCLPPTADLSQY